MPHVSHSSPHRVLTAPTDPAWAWGHLAAPDCGLGALLLTRNLRLHPARDWPSEMLNCTWSWCPTKVPCQPLEWLPPTELGRRFGRTRTSRRPRRRRRCRESYDSGSSRCVLDRGDRGTRCYLGHQAASITLPRCPDVWLSRPPALLV